MFVAATPLPACAPNIKSTSWPYSFAGLRNDVETNVASAPCVWDSGTTTLSFSFEAKTHQAAIVGAKG